MIVIHSYKDSIRCRIKTEWEGEYRGKEGWCYGYINLGLAQRGIVMWDDEDEPELYKISELEEQTITWGNIK